jgi:hypothetical protein
LTERQDSYILTFQDQYTLYQQLTQDYSTAGLVIAKRDINEGGAVFLNRFGRKFDKEYLTASLVANQQYYQLAAGTLRSSEVRCLNGTNYYTPDLVASEEEWNKLNTITTTGSIPSHYYIRGFNEIGLYPIPSAAVTNGLQISLEPQHVDLTQDDYTTGTVTVTNGAVAITHSASGFTPQMVGRWLQVTDGTDGKWYRIASYTSSSVVSLENYYEGVSGSGRTFRIGEIMKIPNGYQDAPVYYAAERFYLTQNDEPSANGYNIRFEKKMKNAKETYGKSTSRQGVKTRRTGRRASWIDLTPPVTYP